MKSSFFPSITSSGAYEDWTYYIVMHTFTLHEFIIAFIDSLSDPNAIKIWEILSKHKKKTN